MADADAGLAEALWEQLVEASIAYELEAFDAMARSTAVTVEG